MNDGGSYLDSYSPFSNNDKDNNDDTPSKPEVTDEEIAELEQRLNLLEHELSQQEGKLEARGNNMFYEDEPNWPAFYPLYHFDIKEISAQHRKYVESSFISWYIMAFAFGLNFLGCFFTLFTQSTVGSPGSKVALSALYLFLFVPLALDIGTLSVYRSFKSGSTLTFTKTFVCLAAFCLFEFIMFLGAKSSGSVGLITTISLFASGYPKTGTLALLVTVSFAVSLSYQTGFLVKMWSYYRGTEGGRNMDSDIKTGIMQFVADTVNKTGYSTVSGSNL